MENKLIKELDTPLKINELLSFLTDEFKLIKASNHKYFVVHQLEEQNSIFANFKHSEKESNKLCLNQLKKGVFSIRYDLTNFPDYKFRIYSDEKLSISDSKNSLTTCLN